MGDSKFCKWNLLDVEILLYKYSYLKDLKLCGSPHTSNLIVFSLQENGIIQSTCFSFLLLLDGIIIVEDLRGVNITLVINLLYNFFFLCCVRSSIYYLEITWLVAFLSLYLWILLCDCVWRKT